MVIKKIIFGFLLVAVIHSISAQTDTLYRKPLIGLGVSTGIVTGHYQESHLVDFGFDLFYMHQVSRRIFVGVSSGVTTYLDRDFTSQGVSELPADPIRFVPIALSIRARPPFKAGFFKNILFGGDMGYAVGLNDLESGFYSSPRITYLLKDKYPLFLGYRMISSDEDLNSIQFGFGIVLNK